VHRQQEAGYSRAKANEESAEKMTHGCGKLMIPLWIGELAHCDFGGENVTSLVPAVLLLVGTLLPL